jgi:adenylate cyclase class 2
VSDGEERELKFAGVELESLRERLLELEAERRGPAAFEDNWVFDDANGLFAAGCLLRLRVDGQGAQLTYKGAARFEGGTKIRRELQTRVKDAEQMRALLESLGYRVRARYQKVREEWRLGGVVISLDHTPIGDFVEFEGEGGEKVATRCGFAPEEAERRSYLQLYADHLKEHPEAPEDMVFP